MAETAVLAPSASGAAPAAHLAHLWLSALTSGDERPDDPDGMPMDIASTRAFLTTQSSALLAVVLSDPFRPRQAAAVGHALVQADFVSADVLGRSLRVLILRLPELLLHCAGSRGADLAGLEARVAEVTAALANGYVRALRDRTLAEQESIRHAELDAQRIISDQLRHQATHDPLTGLPNRAAIFGSLAAALETGRDTSAGLCYLDLDGFKAINDSYGHEAGDELLVTVARRIGETARAYGAIAGRIGGDEFVVVAEVSPGIDGMIAIAAGILGEVSRPVPLPIGRVSISACAGIAECAAGSPGSTTLIADADAALYRAKTRGPGRWAVYGTRLDRARQQAGLLECGREAGTAVGWQTYQAPDRADVRFQCLLR
ncbi:MAG TPA: GGDEF domain-containing protein [Trebonia sp.]